MRIYMEIVFFCLPTNDMLIIFYINFYENSSFNEKKIFVAWWINTLST